MKNINYIFFLILTFGFFGTVFSQSLGSIAQTDKGNNSTEFFISRATDIPRPTSSDPMNWVVSRAYNISGDLLGAGINYFDCFGKPIQSQTRDVKTSKTWANGILYDYQGRPALNTFSSPLSGAAFNFTYQNNLIKKSNGSTFTTNDLESNPERPPLVSDLAGELGWYYSDNNTDELFQDTAEGRPYSRTIYDELTPGKVRAVVGGKSLDVNGNGQEDGLLDEFPQGYSCTTLAAQELYYAFGRDYFDGPISIKNGNEQVILKSFKQVGVDPHGNEQVAFLDEQGKILATARSGGPIKYEVISLIGEQGYVDVHIPEGITNSDISYIGGTWQIFTVWDLRTGEAISPYNITGGHFYRIQYNFAENSEVYITPSGSITHDPEAKGIRYKVNYYDFSLNYYDKSGRLKKTTQPLGFDSSAYNLSTGTPNHTMSSSFEYNAIGELKYSSSPDEGTSNFVYRSDGQIRFSQNEKQANLEEFSYTNYDAHARPIESGVSWMDIPFFSVTSGGTGFTDTEIPNPDTYDIDPLTTKERVYTLYDVADSVGLNTAINTSGFSGGSGFLEDIQRNQRYVSGNVSKTWTEAPKTNTTWYSYDIYGRVTWMVQEVEGLGAKTIDYTYDAITGAVLKVEYQKSNPNERFIHQYIYNDVGQLIRVETSQNNIDFETQITYNYYETGALKRSVLSQGLQFTDYVYNLEGKIKAINHPVSGSDNLGNNANDAFSLTLDYYNGDYTRSNTGITTTNSGANRYDGNIKATRWSTRDLTDQGTQNRFVYSYNSNNWLQSATFGTQNTLIPGLPDYSVSGITYDANGNIKTLRRTKDSHNGSNAMDQLSYNYENETNKLTHVDDNSISTIDVGDIKDQDPNNYVYNAIGQLIENKQDNIGYSYYVNGLVSSVYSTVPEVREGVSFFYNDRGQRIEKQSYDATGITYHTYYVRDTGGQVIGIHSRDPNDQGGGTGINEGKEYPIYGLSRIGMADNFGTFKYELTDHLGNVRAVIQRDGSPQIVYFENFQDNVIDTPPWHDFTLTTVTANQERLKGEVTNFQKPNSIYLGFNAVAHRRYEISFTVDLSETPNDFFYGASPNLVLTNATDISQSGTYSFEYTSLQGGMENVFFGLRNDIITRNNRYYIDNVKIVDISTNNVPTMLAYKDYYPFGMPMPERNIEGEYRYAYQGQEKDPETGKEAFELRLWDARIGRWLTKDPKHEFVSPYLGMGNNPISKIDPDGGQTEDIIYLDIDGNEIDRFVMDGPDIYLQETFSGGIENGLNVGSFEKVSPNQLNPSTVGKNLFGLTYPGGDNPLTFSGDYTYSAIPKDLSGYPAIGHDRRYDNLNIAGASGLFTDTRAIGADYKFVSEELEIASNPFLPIRTRVYSGTLGIGLGLAALPKTMFKLASKPNGHGMQEIMLYYHISSHGVTNTPDK